MSGVDERVTLLTRVGCHLCEQAKAVLDELAAEDGFTWRELDVDADLKLADEFGDRVPVVLVDGREHGYWRVEPARLRRALVVPATS
jgi:glutaredoxin